MKTKPKLARMGGEEEMNGNGLNITIGVDLAPMMRMVVVMMVMKLVEVVGNLKKRRKKDEPNIQLRGQFKTKIYVFIRVSEKTLMLNFAMVKKSRHRFCDEDIDQCGSNWSKGTKMCNFGSKIWIFGAKCQFFCF